MITQQLLDYIADQRARGIADEQTRQALLAQGWPATDVEAAFSGAQSMATSGATMPTELHGWNWGAALLTWIWGIRFKAWLALLAFVPAIGGIWWIVLGIKGNEWAWRAGQWTSVEEFKKAQRPWAVAGFVILGLSVAAFAIAIFMFMSTASDTNINTLYNINL